MATMKIDIDQSELDAAIEKANRLMAMLDEIEGRIAHLDDVGFSDPIVSNVSAPTSPPPPKPKR